jgi:hypothetical protein
MGGKGSGRKPDLARRRRAAALRARGLSLADIGRRLGVSRETVRRMIVAYDPTALLPDICCSACRAAVAEWRGPGRSAGPVLCRS